jgi:hypothetical protein
LAAFLAYKKRTSQIAKDSKNKLSSVTINTSDRFGDNSDPSTEYLDLEIDPTNDYRDLKNILIKIKSDNKINEITLIDYYLPFNSNNITRFNNIFTVYMSDRTYRADIPPGLYSIQTLLSFIKGQINFLEFNISPDNIITITNTIGTKFDLQTGPDTVFPLLGFQHRSDSYVDKVAFIASVKYNIEANKKALFSLSGTSMKPMEMEFDQKIASDTILKKVRSGFNIRQLSLRFADELDYCYDFVMPLSICVRIVYHAS